MRSTLIRSAGLAGAALALAASPALAVKAPAELAPVKRTLEASGTAASTCSARSSDATVYRAPMSGFVSIRSAGSRRAGDWDLFVTDADSKRRLGTSQGFGANEVVQAFVTSGQRLRIQGCRRSGRGAGLPVSVTLADVALPKAGPAPSLLRVRYDSNQDLQRIEQAGLDLTHHIHGGKADVIATGAKQIAKLTQLGLKHEVEIADLNKHFVAARKADQRYAAAVDGESPLPSGRTDYRTYDDYQAELKKLATDNPGLVKPVTLPHETLQGREVTGVEIAKDVDRTDDGRPTYLVVSLHHAREWPSGEAAMEFAHLLTQGYGKDPRITSLLARERIVIVPIVNPDGFSESRGFPVDPADTTGIAALQTVEGVALLGGSMAYRRKNCNGAIPSGDVPCTLQYGVDPNRNYGEGWGGSGAGTDPITQSYRGPGPWSEPETQNIHELSQSRQVTNIITIHTVAALVLRPPGQHTAGLAPDEQRMKAIGDEMAAATGYTSQYGWQLYDTSGTTEDWNYAAAGSYGYTIEMGPVNGEFHMPYQTGVVDEWTGKKGTPAEGKGMREALLVGAEAAANPADHSVLTGKAKDGTVLRLRKEFQTMTGAVCAYAQGYVRAGTVPPADCVAPGEQRAIDDHLDTTMTVPKGGKFAWHVTPSTRPFVGAKYIQAEKTPAREGFEFTPEEGDNKLFLGAVDKAQGTVEREFTVDTTGGASEMIVDLEWAAAPQDYDLELYRVQPDGSRQAVDTSGNPPGSFEQITVPNPQPGKYVLAIVYYATVANDWTAKVSFNKPGVDRVEPTGKTEAWTLTCETPDGQVLGSRDVTIARGQKLDVGAAPCGSGKKGAAR